MKTENWTEVGVVSLWQMITIADIVKTIVSNSSQFLTNLTKYFCLEIVSSRIHLFLKYKSES